MKPRRLAGLLALAATAPLIAHAQDGSYRILSDPAYLPLAGQIYGQTGYAFDSFNADTGRADGTGHEHQWSDIFSQYLAYGLTNRLSFNARLDYAVRHEHDTSPTGTVTGQGREGFENPNFGATWRVIDQAGHHPLDLDLNGYWAPAAFPARTPLDGSDGTVAAGAARAGFGVAVSHVTRPFTLQAAIAANYVGTGHVLDRATASDIVTQSYWSPYVRLATQTRIAPRLSVNVEGDYDFNGNSPDVLDVGSGLLRQVKQSPFGDLKVAVNYHLIPNRLVGSIGYTHNFLGHADIVFPAEPALNAVLTRSSDTVGVSLGYVFR